MCRSDISVIAIITIAGEVADCIDTRVTGNVGPSTLVSVYNNQSLQVSRPGVTGNVGPSTLVSVYNNQSLQV